MMKGGDGFPGALVGVPMEFSFSCSWPWEAEGFQASCSADAFALSFIIGDPKMNLLALVVGEISWQCFEIWHLFSGLNLK